MSSNYPPGVTGAMIDAYFADGPCAICGHGADDCICPECEVCGGVGDKRCYHEHGLKITADQVIENAKAHMAALEAQVVNAAEYVHQLECEKALGKMNLFNYENIVRI